MEIQGTVGSKRDPGDNTPQHILGGRVRVQNKEVATIIYIVAYELICSLRSSYSRTSL